jgi:hypothetical protein
MPLEARRVPQESLRFPLYPAPERQVSSKIAKNGLPAGGCSGYARDKFWKAIGGMHWGDDPDFLPLFLAHGPGGARVNAWDFTEAVKFWTDGARANHGFMLHGDGQGYITGWTREAPEMKNRPAVLAVYEPK